MVIALIALIVVGPEQLPGLMRRAGQFLSQFRSAADGLRDEFMHGVEELDPSQWQQEKARGTGGSDDPIVPRGYANGASATPNDGSTGDVPRTPELPNETSLGETSPGEMSRENGVQDEDTA